MPAEDSLRDAEYGLTMIEQNLGTDKLQYHLRAFLTSLKSVFDYLLEDYNQKYSLGITEDEDLNARRFEEKARQLGHNEAQRFIAWWKVKKGQVKSDRRCAFLLARHGRRDIMVHRRRVPMRVDVEVFESITISDRVRVEKYNNQGKLLEVRESEPTKPPSPAPKPSTIEFYFDGFDIENVVSVCKHCFETLKNVIEEARRNFPL